MTEPIFRRDGDTFVPTAHAVGPWDPGQLHGGAPAALIGEALAEPGFQVSRITFDFLGPVTTEPLTIATETIKPGRRGMQIRFLPGTDYGRGPALAWFRLARPLVGDEPPSAVARVLAAADFGNGVSRIVDFERYLFVNADLTVHLHREPRGEWVLLDARTRLERETGAGLAASTLYDERGPIGLAAQSLFVAAR